MGTRDALKTRRVEDPSALNPLFHVLVHKTSMPNRHGQYTLLKMILICEECFHLLDYTPHICLIRTCPACFSPKSIFQRFCFGCLYADPCHFCQTPSKYKLKNFRICQKHLTRICNLDVLQRHVKRVALNKEYDEYCLRRRITRLAKVFDK